MLAQAIWKYPLDFTAVQTLRLPVGATVRAFQAQGSVLTLWVQVDPREARKSARIVQIVGTGHSEIDPVWRYLGTAQVNQHVWHAFETTPVP